MNKIVLYAFCIATALSSTLKTNMDCIDNSHHLQQKYDHKEYHPVDGGCNCPCEKKYKLYPGRGQCSKCGHYRVPRSTIIVRATNSTLQKGLKACTTKSRNTTTQRTNTITWLPRTQAH